MRLKRRRNIVVNILVGIGSFIVLTLAMVAVGSKLIANQTVDESSIDILAALILLISSIAGNTISIILQGDNILKSSAFTTVGILCIVMISALTADGPFCNVYLKLIAIVGGVGISCVICMKRKGRSNRRKCRYR